MIPQFQHRLPWIPKERLDADMLPYPVWFEDGGMLVPDRAPKVGEHTDEILAKVVGYDADRIKRLRQAGAVQ